MPLGKYLYLGVVYICRVVAVGHVMISLDEEHEVLLRRLAKERHGGGKGSISAIVEEGVDELAKQEKRERLLKRVVARMKKGFPMGFGNRKIYEYRDELYER